MARACSISASPAATGTAEWPAGATASRNPAGANARDARRAGSGCRPGRRPRTSSTIPRRRSACPEQRQQAVCPEATLPARYAGDVHLFVAGAGRRCQRRGRHASRQAQAAACRGAASVEDETSSCCWARWRRWSSSIAARRGTLPSEARCSSIRRRMPARCSSTTRTSSRPANLVVHDPEAAQVALAVGLRDGDGLAVSRPSSFRRCAICLVSSISPWKTRRNSIICVR